jgi:uncharacterized protein YaaN involved in tellurite resistance
MPRWWVRVAEDVDKVTDEYQTCGQEIAHITETIGTN